MDKTKQSKTIFAVYAFFGILILAVAIYFVKSKTPSFSKHDNARQLVNKWADFLDKQTTKTGAYEKWQGETDKDPWGNLILIEYSHGGVMEILVVRSLGPDGQDHTDDDIVAQRQSTNLIGIGEGIKKNAEETAANTAKGLVKGTIEGIKESMGGKKNDKGKD